MKKQPFQKFITLLLCLSLLLSLSSCALPWSRPEPGNLGLLLEALPLQQNGSWESDSLLSPSTVPADGKSQESISAFFASFPPRGEEESSFYEQPGPQIRKSLIPSGILLDHALEEPGSYPDEPDLESGQAFVYCLNSGEMRMLRGKGEKIYPASITKLLTILTALQYLEPDEAVTPGNEIFKVSENSSVAYLNKSYTLSVAQLIEAMMIPSGNDAAYTLSVAAARKASGDPNLSADECLRYMAELMNNYAAELGMLSSHFTTVDGYRDPEHVSTVEDLARLTLAAYECPEIRSCCGLSELKETLLSGDTITWQNSNLMLFSDSDFYDSRVKGMKTGSLNGHNSMVSILEGNGEIYLVGVFTCNEKIGRYRDMQKIISWVFGS